MISLRPTRTALVLIDLQKGITGLPLAPIPGATIVERSKELAARFRAAGAPV
ncbi:hydrolase, partial [Komagataeibacter sp. SM21]